MTELQNKRKARRKETAEDFTPRPLIDEMLNKLPPEVWSDPTKTFLDNSAGNGNFLVAILERKLSLGHPPLQALSTIYGVELMADNVEEMRHRLYTIAHSFLSEKQRTSALEILNYNIVCHDALTWDYDNWRSLTPPKAVPLF